MKSLIMKRRKQNHKIFFHFLSGSPHTPAENGLVRKFLGFAPRELVERGRGAKVIRQNPADFVRNTFELRPIHTTQNII